VVPNFSLALASDEHESRVYLRGELDVASAPELEHAFETMVANALPVVIDCAGLSYCDSFGVRSILLAARRCRDLDLPVHIEHAHGRVRQVLDISGVGNLVDIT
jgi:anti-anti-sigma factor